VLQTIEKEDDCSDIENAKGPYVPKFQLPLEVEVMEIERTERRSQDLHRAARGVWKLVTIRFEDAEPHHRRHNYLR
jgi:hypothetical protein